MLFYDFFVRVQFIVEVPEQKIYCPDLTGNLIGNNLSIENLTFTENLQSLAIFSDTFR